MKYSGLVFLCIVYLEISTIVCASFKRGKQYMLLDWKSEIYNIGAWAKIVDNKKSQDDNLNILFYQPCMYMS